VFGQTSKRALLRRVVGAIGVIAMLLFQLPDMLEFAGQVTAH
jgi:hypothetical protein